MIVVVKQRSDQNPSHLRGAVSSASGPGPPTDRPAGGVGLNIETKFGHIVAATLGAIALLVLVGALRRS
jgi:hypothetical protein